MCETTSIQGTPVEDTAGRTIAYWVWSITMRDIIQDDNGCDQDVQDALDQLTKPAQAFLYIAHGFKALRINVTGQRDVI